MDKWMDGLILYHTIKRLIIETLQIETSIFLFSDAFFLSWNNLCSQVDFYLPEDYAEGTTKPLLVMGFLLELLKIPLGFQESNCTHEILEYIARRTPQFSLDLKTFFSKIPTFPNMDHGGI